MFLLKSLTGLPGQYEAHQGRIRGLYRDKCRPWPLLLERLENPLCLSTWEERLKRHVLLAIMVAIVMAAFVPCASADLYVCSRDGNEVLRYNEVTGEFIQAFVRSDNNGGLDSPRLLLFGRDGNLYVSSFNTNSVMRYDGTSGAPLPSVGQTGGTFVSTGSGGLSGAAGLILGRDDNLYVSSRSTDRVLRYSGTSGDFLDAFVPEGSGGLNNPRALVFGPDGNLYVNSFGTNIVLRYDGSTGAFLGTFAAGDPLAQNNSCVFGPDGNLYVTNSSSATNSILRFNGVTGEFMDTFISPGSGGLTFPTGLIFGPDSNLYVSSRDTNSVLRYDGITGAFIDAFIPAGSGGLIAPVGLFFTNTDPTTLAYVPPLRSRFLITAASTAVSGTPFDITVTALDPAGNIDTSYPGTVTFTTSDPDPGVVLPADYTFTIGDGVDNGVHTFPGGVTLVTGGAQTLTVTDTASGITGSATVTVGPGP
jgi:WD40 repeat protein